MLQAQFGQLNEITNIRAIPHIPTKPLGAPPLVGELETGC
jgi:hypothetical protein